LPLQSRDTLRLAIVLLCGALPAALVWYLKTVDSFADLAGESGPVTFSKDVAPIIFAKCSSCHHPDQAAPFSLLNYDDVRRRARQIVDVTQSGFMPPWLPAEGHGDFAGARRLTARERQSLKRWVDSGMPLGDESEMPAAPVVVDSWQADPPDLVLETPAYALRSQERDVFRNFVVPIEWETPRWVQSIELRPLNPRVTHHARLGVDSSNESVRRDAADDDPGYAGMAWGQDPDGQLVIWAPGMAPAPPAPGVAWRLYPKSCLVLHTHMQPSGKPEVVKFRIGIRFAKEPPRLRPAILRIGSCAIDIPAGARQHAVNDQYTLPIDVDVHTIFPHAHSLCQKINVVAHRPDGTREPLIAIERFDESWHDSYRYRSPVRLPRGTRLISTFTYDNSEHNVRNRNRPSRRVVYGSNAGDEMADVYLQVTAVRPDQRDVLMENYNRYALNAQVVGYNKSLELHPDDPWSQEGLATCYVGLGQPQKAIAILEKRLKAGPKAVFPLVSLGMALSASGDHARAEERHRQAIAMDGDYPLAWFGLGKALAGQKKLEPAEEAYRRAAQLAPGTVEAHLQLADLLIQRGQLDQAAEACAAALQFSPEMPGIYLKLAEISAKRKHYDDSLAYCMKARQAAPYTHPPKVLVAVFCFANGEQDRGVQLLREARAEAPDHPMPALFLGQLARRQRQGQSAREHLTAAAALAVPDNWPESHKQRFLVLLHSERFQLAQQLSDAELARDALAQWIKSDPGNGQLRKRYEELSGRPPP
jgi:tetratricopeptide (TPR) repeat protein